MNRTHRWGPRRSLAAIAIVGCLVMFDDPAGAYGPPGDAGEVSASTIGSLSLWSPVLRDSARDGWPMARTTPAQRVDVQRAVVRAVRYMGCRVTRARAVSTRGAELWTVRTDARMVPGRSGVYCRGYRAVRAIFFEDGSGVGWPTPAARPAPIR